MFGIDATTYKRLSHYFERIPWITQVRIYGSRAIRRPLLGQFQGALFGRCYRSNFCSN